MCAQITSEGNLSTVESIVSSHHPSVPETDHYEIPSTAALFKELEDGNQTTAGGGGGVELDTFVHRDGSRGLTRTQEEQSAQKQKNLYQMIQMLSARLANLDGIGK